MSTYLVKDWLGKCKYHYQQKTKLEIKTVTEMYRSLRPCLEMCTLPNGMKRELVILKGTIPVSYRRNIYHIPISIWILNNHPDSAPICWVNPTRDMTIKVSKHVDQQGRVYLPYLAEWDSNSSDILGAIQVMIILFGESPPLYSKPKNDQSNSTPTSGYPPSSSSTNPAPPYPTQFPNQYPYLSGYPSIQPITPVTNSYPAPSSDPGSFSYPSFSVMPTPGYGGGSESNKPLDTGTITKEHLRLSLLSAVEDKLRIRSKEILMQHNAEIGVLKRTGEDLKEGREKLERLVTEMEKNFNELEKCKEKINKQDAKLTELIEKMESDEKKLDIDEYFGPVQPLYKQLFNTFVEENSIIDTIFNINQALQKGVIDLDLFLKYIRELSRRQFMVRALIRQCREKAGLPT